MNTKYRSLLWVVYLLAIFPALYQRIISLLAVASKKEKTKARALAQ